MAQFVTNNYLSKLKQKSTNTIINTKISQPVASYGAGGGELARDMGPMNELCPPHTHKPTRKP